MFKFLFGGPKRLEDVEDGQAALARDNARLRAKLARLEIGLVQRRADDILGARDCGIPIPRPGSAAARLLVQNRGLRKRTKAAEARAEQVVETALADLFSVADNLEHAGLASAAIVVRERADALVAKVKAVEAPMAAEVSVDLYAEHVRTTWNAVDHWRVADDWLTRFDALAPSAHRPRDAADVAAIGGLVVSTLLSSGPQAAADIIRRGPALTEDACAVGAEATLYALAGQLGDAWTEDVRAAWSLAIDDVIKALGFPGNNTTIFSMEDSLAMSQS